MDFQQIKQTNSYYSILGNIFQDLMDSEFRSRLPSISEQEPESQISVKTSQALLNVYFQLFAINYVELPSEPSSVFQNISNKIQKQYANDLLNFKPFIQEQTKQTIYKNKKQIKNISLDQSSIKKSKIVTKQDLIRKMKSQKAQSNVQITPNKKQQQFVQTMVKQSKGLDETADSPVSITDLLDKLNIFDEQRTEIKFAIYAEEGGKIDKLYFKWADVHKRMKEVLQLFINKIGNGKTLLQIYSDIDNLKNSNKVIERYKQKQLLSKLDIYLQSLFLDEREIILYRNSSQKSRNVYSSPGPHGYGKNIKKKLNFI